MDNQAPYVNLNFNQGGRQFPRRIIPVGLGVILFNLLWFYVPRTGQYWLLTIAITVTVWIASYGWHKAVHRLIHFMHRIENL